MSCQRYSGGLLLGTDVNTPWRSLTRAQKEARKLGGGPGASRLLEKVVVGVLFTGGVGVVVIVVLVGVVVAVTAWW